MGIRFLRLTCVAALALTFVPSLPVAAAQTGKITAIKFSGSKKYTEAQLTAASGLHVGDSVGRDEIQATANRLGELGLFQSVRFHFTSSGDNISIQFQVEDAPTVPVSFDNFAWFSDAELADALKQAVTLFDDTAPEQGTILAAMTGALQKLLAARGIHATVERSLMVQPLGEGMMQQFKVVGGGVKVGAIQFSDALAIESRRLHERLSDLVAKPYSRFALEVFASEQVRPLYLERGYLRVRIGKPQIRLTGNPDRPMPDSVLVVIPIEPGPVYNFAGVEWQGNAAFGPAALNEFVALNIGEVADGMKIAGTWLRVQTEYGRRGYLDAKLQPEPVYEAAAHRVGYRVTVTEGPQYQMGELVITGLSPAAERRLTEAWRIPRGQIFDRVYFDEFLTAGIKQAFRDYVVHYDEVGRWLRTNPEDQTVNVLLDFR